MFVAAVERATQFTRPIHTIVRNYGSDLVQPGTSTLFFVNPSGWALTCKHVVGVLAESDVKVVVTISGACSATQTFYKCGAATDSYQFSACGKTHTVSTTSNWEDAMADCSVIGYAAQ